MAYTNPGYVNGQQPYINAANINAMANTLECVPIANGGTGATTIENARHNLGLENIENIIGGSPLEVAQGGTGETSLAGMKQLLGLYTQGRPFYAMSASQYCTAFGVSQTVSYSVDNIAIPCCIYVGAAGQGEQMYLSGLPTGVSSANLYIITLYSPTASTTRRLQFVVPEVGNRTIYMKCLHGSTDTGWGKISFTAV